MRRAAKVDANHSEVVKALRNAGCLVHDTSAVGGGFPDLVVEFRGQVTLIEVKDGKKPPSERKLTPQQEEFSRAWKRWICVTSADEAVRVVMG